MKFIKNVLFILTIVIGIHGQTHPMLKRFAALPTRFKSMAQNIALHVNARAATLKQSSPRSCIAKVAGFFGLFGAASCYNFSKNESFDKPLNKNGSLVIENSAGSIKIRGWDQDKLDVQATKKASTQLDLDETRIELE